MFWPQRILCSPTLSLSLFLAQLDKKHLICPLFTLLEWSCCVQWGRKFRISWSRMFCEAVHLNFWDALCMLGGGLPVIRMPMRTWFLTASFPQFCTGFGWNIESVAGRIKFFKWRELEKAWRSKYNLNSRFVSKISSTFLSKWSFWIFQSLRARENYPFLAWIPSFTNCTANG